MATATETVRNALRDYVRRLGARPPDSTELADGLRRLNGWLRMIIGFGGSLPYRDIPVDGDYEITTEYPCVRIQCQHSAAMTVTLPEGSQWRPVRDGFRVAIVDASGAAATNNITLARNGWKIAGSAANATISTNNASVDYMFRADLGDWKLAADLAAGDDLPFPTTFDEGIAAILGSMLAPSYGVQLAPEQAQFARMTKSQIYARYCRAPMRVLEAGASYAGTLHGTYPITVDDFESGNF